MHTLFSDWYRITNVDPSEDTLEKRWQGIENIVNNLNTRSSLDLVRLFFGKSIKNSIFTDTFREAFKETDQTFTMSGNDLELQILAGISIIQSLEANDETNVNTALSTICVSFQEPATMPPFPEVLKRAKEFLLDRSREVRSRQKTNNIKTTLADLSDQKNVLLASLPANSLPNTKEPMGAIFDKIQEIITQVISEVNQIATEIDLSLLLQQEETEMLWWLIGEYSNSLKKRISKIPLPFACLIIAKELSEHTQVIPGPVNILALVDKMLNTVREKTKEETSIKEVVNTATIEWKSQYLAGINLSSVEDLCPLHYAINKSVETGDSTSWIASFEKSMGIKAEQSVTPLDISIQAYNEMLLLSNIE